MNYLLLLLPLWLFVSLTYFVVFQIHSLLIWSAHLTSFYITIGILLVGMCILFISSYLNLTTISTIMFYFFTSIFILFFITLIFAGIFKLPRLRNKNTLQLVLIGVTFVCYMSYGIYNANTFSVKDVYLESDKISQDTNFALISDNHIGSNWPKYLQRVVDKINTLDVDFVALPWDLVDSKNVTIEDLKSLNTLDIPIYYVIGNHEVMEHRDANFFKQSHLTVLDNEKISFNNEIDIIGIDFYNPQNAFKAKKVENLMQNIEVDDTKYNLLLNHEPAQLKPVVDRKIDLQVSGHTHAGQMWPFNYFVRLRYKYVYGLHKLSEYTQLYVTSGVGTWGPRIRVGSKNEIVVFHIKSQNNS